MGDVFKQTLTLALGGIIVGLAMFFLERGDEQRPDVTAIVQHAELNEGFLEAFFEHMVSKTDEELSITEEQLDEVEVQNIASNLLMGSGMSYGGTLEVYFIENKSDNRPYDIILQSRDFEYAVVLEEAKITEIKEGVEYKLRLLPSQYLRAVVVTDSSVSTLAPHYLLDDQRIFASIDGHSLPFVRLANFSPYESAPEAWVKRSPKIAVVLSFLGVVLFILLIIVSVLSVLMKNNIQFYTSLLSTDEIARSHLAFDWIRRNRPAKLKQVEMKIEELREGLSKPEDSAS